MRAAMHTASGRWARSHARLGLRNRRHMCGRAGSHGWARQSHPTPPAEAPRGREAPPGREQKSQPLRVGKYTKQYDDSRMCNMSAGRRWRLADRWRAERYAHSQAVLRGASADVLLHAAGAAERGAVF